MHVRIGEKDAYRRAVDLHLNLGLDLGEKDA
jgi:hypothetical protein